MIRVQTENFGKQSTIKCATKKGPYSLGKHIHQFWEIIYVRDGEIRYNVDEQKGVAKAGDVIIVSPFRTHSYNAPVYCDIWLCLFTDDFISDFSLEGDFYYTCENPVFTPSKQVLSYFKTKLVDTGETFIYDNPPLFRRMKAAIFAIYEEYTAKTPTAISNKNAVASSPMLSVMVYLSNHFKENLTLSQVAKKVGYNPDYISQCLKDLEGVNFRYMLNSFRVEYAKKLLYSTDKSIPDVASEVGFTCERSFHRAFTTMTGKTPSKFRKQWYTPKYVTSDNVDFSLTDGIVDIGVYE